MTDANKIFFQRYKIIDYLRDELEYLKILTDVAVFLIDKNCFFIAFQ